MAECSYATRVGNLNRGVVLVVCGWTVWASPEGFLGCVHTHLRILEFDELFVSQRRVGGVTGGSMWILHEIFIERQWQHFVTRVRWRAGTRRSKVV